MRYKVTAIKTVEILAKVRREQAPAQAAGRSLRPADDFKWIFLSAGEVRDGLDFVIGIMASYVPNEPADFRAGKKAVLLPLNDKLPKVYFDLFELENSAIPD